MNSAIPARPLPDLDQAPLLLVGHPNVGKSVLFGALTGTYVTVSNYPGTTVSLTRGKTEWLGEAVEVVDTPGVNGLTPLSEDEEVTRDILLETPARAVLQVADAKNLRRALLLTLQLQELDVPLVMALNMTDEATSLGVGIDRATLARDLGIPVVRTIAVRGDGFDELRKSLAAPGRGAVPVLYPPGIETAAREIGALLPDSHVARRGLALMLLAGDDTLDPWLTETLGPEGATRIRTRVTELRAGFDTPPEITIAHARQKAAERLSESAEYRPARRASGPMAKLGDLSTHPLWGIPVLLVVLWLMYQFVGVFGAGTSVDFLESTVFGEYISPAAIRGVDAVFPFPHEHAVEDGMILPDYTLTGPVEGLGPQIVNFCHDFLVGPYGQVTMALAYALALILPIVTTFFLAFGALEDSGYLPRLAVMMNRLFRIFGLNGKAVLPMVLGLGCDTMATLTTRILDTKKERILVTLLLALAVPCSAQLGVILGMMRALSLGATLIWGGTVFLTMVAVGWIAAQLVPGDRAAFVLELPPLRRPHLRNILVKTWARMRWYLWEAVPLFLLGTLLLFLADRFGALLVAERVSAPLVQGVLGLPAEATEAFLVGFLRRDYGAAGLYDLSRQGMLDGVQLVVSMVVITLFIPCIANFFVMIKERGWKTALAMTAFIFPMSFLVGGLLRAALRVAGISF